MNAILAVRAWYDKARDMQNSRERYEQMSKVRIHIYINKLLETKAAPGCYEDIVDANKIYKVVTAVRIIEESGGYSCYKTDDLRGQSGTVVMCCMEGNHRSHYVAVYVLLDEFKAHGPLVVVDGDSPKHVQIRGGRTSHKTSN